VQSQDALRTIPLRSDSTTKNRPLALSNFEKQPSDQTALSNRHGLQNLRLRPEIDTRARAGKRNMTSSKLNEVITSALESGHGTNSKPEKKGPDQESR